MLRLIKAYIRIVSCRYLFLKIPLLIISDLVSWLGENIGYIYTDSGSRHANMNTDQSLAYIGMVFEQYCDYHQKPFAGELLEIGPGDNAGVALRFLKAGYQHAVLVDRHDSRRDLKQQNAIYRRLSEKYDLGRYVEESDNDVVISSSIEWHIGISAEQYVSAEANRKFDLIISRAVFEHLADPLFVLQRMIGMLSAGGMIIHRIDFRDHGMFSGCHHDLKYLEINPSIYRYMVRNTGRPNRVLIDQYVEMLESMRHEGLIEYSVKVTRIAYQGELASYEDYDSVEQCIKSRSYEQLEKHRASFAEEYSGMNARDLLIAGAFIVIHRS